MLNVKFTFIFPCESTQKMCVCQAVCVYDGVGLYVREVSAVSIMLLSNHWEMYVSGNSIVHA